MLKKIKILNQIFILQFTLPLIIKFAWHLIPSRRKRFSYISNESKRLLKALECQSLRKVVLVYDNSSSPLSYGDFINVLMIGRFLAACQIDVKLILTNSVFLPFFVSRFSKEQLNEFVEEEKRIAENLVDRIEVEFCSSQDLGLVLDRCETDGWYVVFHELVRKNKPFYFLAFNLTKSLLVGSPEEIKALTLFSKSTSFVSDQRRPSAKYVTFACRWNQSWGQYRNMSTELFVNMVKLLSVEFPSFEIIAVSDRIGCDHFRNIANDFQLACSFSKDYSDSFLGDVSLVLGSEGYVQIRGGGLGIIPLWSDLPFLFFGRISSEQALLSRKTSQFRNINQRFFVDYGLPSNRRLKKKLAQMASGLSL